MGINATVTRVNECNGDFWPIVRLSQPRECDASGSTSKNNSTLSNNVPPCSIWPYPNKGARLFSREHQTTARLESCAVVGISAQKSFEFRGPRIEGDVNVRAFAAHIRDGDFLLFYRLIQPIVVQGRKRKRAVLQRKERECMHGEAQIANLALPRRHVEKMVIIHFYQIRQISCTLLIDG